MNKGDVEAFRQTAHEDLDGLWLKWVLEMCHELDRLYEAHPEEESSVLDMSLAEYHALIAQVMK